MLKEIELMRAILSLLILATLTGVATLAAGDTLFDVELDSCSYGGAAIYDVSGDGALDVLFGTYYNDERVIAMNADGSFVWTLGSGGGPVDNSVTVADLDRDGTPEVMWGNSGTTQFHVTDALGNDLWTYTTREVLDAPEAVGDVNGDGQLDIVLASCGSDDGGLRAFTGISGELLWTAEVGGCYQSAPLLFDGDGDGLLDVVVSTWFDDKVRAFSGQDGSLRWETQIGDQTYHAGSFGDLNGDGTPDVALGDYSGTLWAIDGASGDVLWSRALPGVRYVFGPTAMGDLDDDGELEIVVAAERLLVYDSRGDLVWATDLPGFCARGPVLVDTGTGQPDVLVAVRGPLLVGYRGASGQPFFEHRFEAPAATEAGFHPAVADLNGDGANDMFVVFGRGRSDSPGDNWGRAVAVTIGGAGSQWPTYSHDHHHSGNYHYPPGADVNIPTPAPRHTIWVPYAGRG
jgi:hypothetical protein